MIKSPVLRTPLSASAAVSFRPTEAKLNAPPRLLRSGVLTPSRYSTFEGLSVPLLRLPPRPPDKVQPGRS